MSRNFVDGYKWNNISELIAILEEIKRLYGHNVSIEKDEYPGCNRSIDMHSVRVKKDEKYLEDEDTETYTIIF